MTETKDLYAVDGCVFTEGNFIGLSDRFKNSYLTAFFLTTPGETEATESALLKSEDSTTALMPPAAMC